MFVFGVSPVKEKKKSGSNCLIKKRKEKNENEKKKKKSGSNCLKKRKKNENEKKEKKNSGSNYLT